MDTSSLDTVIAVISVNHPLDYEQIPNGLIYLTVMAKDAGNPPLNSTVPVTIEVFVSTQGRWPGPSCVRLVNAPQAVRDLPRTLCPPVLGCPHSSGVTWQMVPKAGLANLCQLGQGRSRALGCKTSLAFLL